MKGGLALGYGFDKYGDISRLHLGPVLGATSEKKEKWHVAPFVKVIPNYSFDWMSTSFVSVGGAIHAGKFAEKYGRKGNISLTPSITALVNWSGSAPPVSFGGVMLAPGAPDKKVKDRPEGFDKKYLTFNMKQLFPIDLK